MGFGDFAKGVANIGTGGLFGALTGSGAPSQPGVAAMDPNIQRARDEQIKGAQDFRKGLPGYKNEQINMAGEDSRRNLAQSISGINSNMNSRGLLYSGVNQGAQAGARSSAASQYASKIADINRGAELQADQLDTGAIKSGVGAQQASQQRENMLYNQALTQRQNKSAGINAITGGVGAGLGSFLGSR